MKIPIKKFHKNAVIPEFATAGAACMDVVATEIEIVEGGLAICKLGFGTQIPEGYKACFSPRSSFSDKTWVMSNTPAQIDSDYRGEWMIKFQAIPVGSYTMFEFGGAYMKYSEFPYKVGDRVAQMWIEEVIPFEFELVEELADTERGSGGFGSTGK